jgi:S1-C subfamily serine protease
VRCFLPTHRPPPPVRSLSINATTHQQTLSKNQPNKSKKIPRGVGSGFVWDTKGHVVTNAHVVAGASEVKVTLYDGTSHAAKVCMCACVVCVVVLVMGVCCEALYV